MHLNCMLETYINRKGGNQHNNNNNDEQLESDKIHTFTILCSLLKSTNFEYSLLFL